MAKREVYISLGSNIGDRRGHIENALREIAKTEGTAVIRCSSVYETAPWGYTEQESFYNVVALLETEKEPEELLDSLLEIEQKGGRVRLFRYAPRTIDIDILLVKGFTSCTEKLMVPHPRLKERAFVLVPLAEIADKGFEEVYGFCPESLIDPADLKGIHKLS